MMSSAECLRAATAPTAFSYGSLHIILCFMPVTFISVTFSPMTFGLVLSCSVQLQVVLFTCTSVVGGCIIICNCVLHTICCGLAIEVFPIPCFLVTLTASDIDVILVSAIIAD